MEVFKASPRDRAQQRFVEQNILTLLFPHGGDLHGLSQGQGSTAFCGADHVDIPVPPGRVGKRGLQGFPRGQSSTASAVEQTFSQAPHRSKPRASAAVPSPSVPASVSSWRTWTLQTSRRHSRTRSRSSCWRKKTTRAAGGFL